MKKNLFIKYEYFFNIFMLGSFLGFVHENLLMLLKGNYSLRQGVIYEPLIPVYGAGILAFYFLYHRVDFKNLNKYLKIILVFLMGMIGGGAVEYLFSYLQEKIFGTISWDYSYLRFNLNGRTSLLHASFWGLMGVLFYELLLPRIISFKMYLNYNWTKVLTIVFSFIFLFDATISSIACYRQGERREGLLPTNSVERFLDTHYPDEYLNKIYNNAKVLPK